MYILHFKKLIMRTMQFDPGTQLLSNLYHIQSPSSIFLRRQCHEMDIFEGLINQYFLCMRWWFSRSFKSFSSPYTFFFAYLQSKSSQLRALEAGYWKDFFKLVRSKLKLWFWFFHQLKQQKLWKLSAQDASLRWIIREKDECLWLLSWNIIYFFEPAKFWIASRKVSFFEDQKEFFWFWEHQIHTALLVGMWWRADRKAVIGG